MTMPHPIVMRPKAPAGLVGPREKVNRFWASLRLYHLIEKFRAPVPTIREAEHVHGNEVE